MQSCMGSTNWEENYDSLAHQDVNYLNKEWIKWKKKFWISKKIASKKGKYLGKKVVRFELLWWEEIK